MSETHVASTLQAVLFDMDGTLVDSERLWGVALDELATHYGGALSEAARMAMVGTNMADSMRLFHDDLGLDGDIAESQAELEERVKKLFRDGVPWQVGARELLHEIHAAGVPTALVTATHRHVVDVMLPTLGPEHFDVVVCGDDVTRAKPDPEPYLHAARLLGVDPARCVAVEDSPTGAAAAEAAGCVVLAVPSEVPVPPGLRRTIRPSLSGIGLADLHTLHTDHA